MQGTATITAGSATTGSATTSTGPTTATARSVVTGARFALKQFKERSAKSYGLKRTTYHMRVSNPPETHSTGHANIIKEFEERLAEAIDKLIEDLPDHDRIQVYLSSNRLRSAHTLEDGEIHWEFRVKF